MQDEYGYFYRQYNSDDVLTLIGCPSNTTRLMWETIGLIVYSMLQATAIPVRYDGKGVSLSG